MSAIENPRRRFGSALFTGVVGALAGASAFAGMAMAANFGSASDTKVAERLKARLPKTQVSKVDCAVVDGLCEVTAGSNLFYVDRSGRYLVIGRVYDMETRQDLTATRLLEINPDTLVGGAAKANAAPDRGDAPLTSADRPAVPTTPKQLSLAGLPKDGAIVWGNMSGKTVTVFSDFECGFCKALSTALASLNVRVVERPISALNTRALSNQVYCANDRVKALHSAYAREPLAKSPACDTSGLDANERFAKAHGLLGTPVLVRGDGAVMEGFRSAELTAAFIAGSRS
jgi:thiol:disulfide interchange protein DsbC